MRHQQHSRVFGPPPMRCVCCGAVERQGGCVRGLPCRCYGLALKTTWCKDCQKCPEHCQCKPKDTSANEVRALQIIVDASPQTVLQGIVNADEAEYRRLHQQYRVLYEQIVEVAKPMMDVQARAVEAMLRERHPEWRALAVTPVVTQWSDTLAMRLTYSFEGAGYLSYAEGTALSRELEEYVKSIG